MKKLFLTLSLLACVKLSMGQLQISGTVKNVDKNRVMQLSYPYDDSYGGTFDQSKPLTAKADASGRFSFSVNETQPQFMVFNNKGYKSYLLLIPGKPLSITVTDNNIVTTNPENEALLKTALNDSTFVVNRLLQYKKWSADSLTNIVLPGAEKELNAELNNISQLKIAAPQKNLLTTELKYYYANTLLNFGINVMRNDRNPAAFTMFANALLSKYKLPLAEELINSPAANTYLHYNAVYAFVDLGSKMRADRSKTKEIAEGATGLPLDSIMKLSNQYGEDYITVLLSSKIMPAYASEKFIANTTLHHIDNRDFTFGKRLQADLTEKFPNSTYLPIIKTKLLALEKDLTEATKNKEVVFINNTSGIKTVAELLAPYKGKVVYLDVWGTWCGPCMNEIINYAAPLKERFKSKDVVFLYLQMDYEKPNDEKKWKEMAAIHNMAGYHVRMNKEQIENIWVDLLGTKNVPRLYPTYVIFDRQGNPIDKQAKRPSDGEALYKELEATLSK